MGRWSGIIQRSVGREYGCLGKRLALIDPASTPRPLTPRRFMLRPSASLDLVAHRVIGRDIVSYEVCVPVTSRSAASAQARTIAIGRFGWLLSAAATLVLSLAAGCGKETPTAAKGEQSTEVPVLQAETFLVQQATWPTIVRCQGTLYADEAAAVGARVAGRVAEVHVDLGDAVKAGQPLVSLQTDEFELLVAQAEAELAQARSAVGLLEGEPVERLSPENSPPVRRERAVWDEAKASLRRAKSLFDQNAIARGEFDLASSAERVAEASYAAALNSVREKIAIIGVRSVALAVAKQRLEDAVIRAPFDGYVESRRVAPGSYISAGAAVVSLTRTDPIWFRGTLPERYVAQLTTGLQISVRIQSLSQPVTATITRISPSLDLATRSLAFEARIDNPQQQFRSGLFAQADVVLNAESQSLIVPESAVSDFAGTEKVWKLVNGVAQQFEIATGVRRNGFVEIVEGLTNGDHILVDASIGRVAQVVPTKTAESIAGPPPTGETRKDTPPNAPSSRDSVATGQPLEAVTRVALAKDAVVNDASAARENSESSVTGGENRQPQRLPSSAASAP